jgi:hypothetical protein
LPSTKSQIPYEGEEVEVVVTADEQAAAAAVRYFVSATLSIYLSMYLYLSLLPPLFFSACLQLTLVVLSLVVLFFVVVACLRPCLRPCPPSSTGGAVGAIDPSTGTVNCDCLP